MSFSSLPSVTLSFIISVGKGKYTDVCIIVVIIMMIITIIITMTRSSLDQPSRKPLFTYPAEMFKRASLTLESAGRDWIPLHILSPSLPCQPLWSGAGARCSAQQFHSSAAPGAPLCAHKLSERGAKRTVWIHAAPVLSSQTPGDF